MLSLYWDFTGMQWVWLSLNWDFTELMVKQILEPTNHQITILVTEVEPFTF